MIYKLEDRVLFDAALPVDVVDSVVAEDVVEESSPEYDSDEVVTDQVDTCDQAESTTLSEDLEVLVSTPSELLENPLEENSLVIIDTSVSDYESLIEAIGDTATIELVDSSQSGVDQITDILSRYDNLDALHILSEGGEGHIVLGSDVLWQSNVEQFGDNLSLWSDSLNTDADILLYGCDTASSERGQSLINSISALTGADIASSTNLTGDSAQGGDWELEFNTGDIEAETLSFNAYDNTFADIVVDAKNDDVLDGAGNDGIAGTSLREAIYRANANSDTSTIAFDPDVFTAGDSTITLNGTELTISTKISIVGADHDGDGLGDITLDANSDGGNNGAVSFSKDLDAGDGVVDYTFYGDSRHFNIANGGDATISYFNLINGKSATYWGGSVYVDQGGTAVLNNVEISDSYSNWHGGAVAANGGSLTVNDSYFHDNYADQTGGAVKSTKDGGATIGGTVTINDSIISNNFANWTGGGINVNNTASLFINNSSIMLNTSIQSGAGIYADAAASLELYNSTLSTNSYSGWGSALSANNTDISMSHCTVSGHSFARSIHVTGAGDFTLDSSIVAGNTADSELNIESTGTKSYRYSWVGSTGNGGFTTANGNIIDSDVSSLSALDVTTGTHGISFFSQAKDAAAPVDGSDTTTSDSDQRGQAMIDGRRDIGAYENADVLTPPTDFKLEVTTTGDSGDNVSISVDYQDDVTDGGGLSLREALFWAKYSTGSIVSFSSVLDGATIELTSGLSVVGPVNITGFLNAGGTNAVTIDGKDNQIFLLSDTDAGTAAQISISNLNLKNGSAANGGAIYADGVNVTLNSISITGSEATAGSGGGIYISNGNLSAYYLQVTDCTATNFGGGIYAENGDVNLELSTIDLNKAGGNYNIHGGLWVAGGGIYVNVGSLTLTDSVVSNNESTFTGAGAIVVIGDSGGGDTFNLTNTTITGNTNSSQWVSAVATNYVDVEMSHSVIVGSSDSSVNNTLAFGPANGSVTINHSILVGNNANDIEAGGGSSFTINDSWVASIRGAYGGANAKVGGDGASATPTELGYLGGFGSNGSAVNSYALTNILNIYTGGFVVDGSDRSADGEQLYIGTYDVKRNFSPEGSIVVSGTIADGQTVGVDHSLLVDRNGLGAFSYQWQQSTDGTTWNDIAGAVGATYDLDDIHIGNQMRVVVSYTDNDGFSESITSDATTAVTATNDEAPTITLTGKVTSLPEQTLGSATKVGVITLSDDGAIGINDLSLSGDDAALFQIVEVGGDIELQLKSGSVLDYDGSNSVIDVNVVVTDQAISSQTDSDSLQITLTDVNETPELADGAASFTEDDVISVDLTQAFSDEDGDSLSYTIISGPAEISLSAGGTELEGSLPVGTYDVVVKATDPDGLNVTETITITVTSKPVQVVDEATGGSNLTHEQIETAAGERVVNSSISTDAGTQPESPRVEPVSITDGSGLGSDIGSVELHGGDSSTAHYVEPVLAEQSGWGDSHDATHSIDVPTISVVESIIGEWRQSGELEFSREEAEAFLNMFDGEIDFDDEWEKRGEDAPKLNPATIFYQPQIHAPAFRSSLHTALEKLCV